MSILERRRVFKVCGQGTSARRSSRYARAAHRQPADMEPCILGDLIPYQENGKGCTVTAKKTWPCRLNHE